jgi:hypothetical protein
VLLCLLLVLTGSPALALCRSENRVWGFSEKPADFASYETAKPIDTPSENPGCGYDFASGVHKYLYAQASPIDLDDPTGNYSSWEQFMGYEAQDAIVDHYKDTHPWINPNDILSDAHVSVKSRKYTYLKPDIINKATKQWLEIKTLSPWGIAKGLAKYELDKTLLKGHSADASWTPLLELETDSGEAILVVNCGGVVYWIDKDFVTDSAGFAAGVAAGAVADQLLKCVAQQVAVRSLAPMAARATAFLAEAFSADVGASLGVASFNSLEAGAP